MVLVLVLAVALQVATAVGSDDQGHTGGDGAATVAMETTLAMVTAATVAMETAATLAVETTATLATAATATLAVETTATATATVAAMVTTAALGAVKQWSRLRILMVRRVQLQPSQMMRCVDVVARLWTLCRISA